MQRTGILLVANDKLTLGDLALDVGAAGQPLPTLFVQEGGYATAEMGRNVHRVLSGFMRRA